MMHCASIVMYNDAQCDFGNFEALADFLKGKNMVWKIFLGHFIIWMMHNDAQCIIVCHLYTLCIINDAQCVTVQP